MRYFCKLSFLVEVGLERNSEGCCVITPFYAAWLLLFSAPSVVPLWSSPSASSVGIVL
jgi:hypothetical protein